MGIMSYVATVEPWHYWISYALVGSIALGIVATLIGYYVKVVSNKYPKE